VTALPPQIFWDPEAVAALTHWVRGRQQQEGACLFSGLAEDIKRANHFRRWHLVSHSVCLAVELVCCSRNSMGTSVHIPHGATVVEGALGLAVRKVEAGALKIKFLRNALMHPGSPSFVKELRKNLQDSGQPHLVTALEKSPGFLL